MDDLVKFAQILSALCSLMTVLLATYVLVCKKNELFRGSIYNKQIDELLTIRFKLQSIWFQIYYSHFWAQNILASNDSLYEFEKRQPEDWLRHRKFIDDCTYIFYTFSNKKNGLLPHWFQTIEHNDLEKALETIQPFTIYALSKKTSTEIIDFQNLVLKKISSIDYSLNQQT